jgi:flagellar biosynthesis GTPase FlhF
VRRCLVQTRGNAKKRRGKFVCRTRFFLLSFCLFLSLSLSFSLPSGQSRIELGVLTVRLFIFVGVILSFRIESLNIKTLIFFVHDSHFSILSFFRARFVCVSSTQKENIVMPPKKKATTTTSTTQRKATRGKSPSPAALGGEEERKEEKKTTAAKRKSTTTRGKSQTPIEEEEEEEEEKKEEGKEEEKMEKKKKSADENDNNDFPLFWPRVFQ